MLQLERDVVDGFGWHAREMLGSEQTSSIEQEAVGPLDTGMVNSHPRTEILDKAAKN